MITTETPYKLADIIRDTWPQLYRGPGVMNKFNQDKSLDSKIDIKPNLNSDLH